jgi:hypothetical protein
LWLNPIAICSKLCHKHLMAASSSSSIQQQSLFHLLVFSISIKSAASGIIFFSLSSIHSGWVLLLFSRLSCSLFLFQSVCKGSF